MNDEVAVQEKRELVIPGVGAVVDLTDGAQVAQALRDVRDYSTQIQSARATLEAALVEQSAGWGGKTLHLGGLVARIGPDTETDYDVTVLIELLDAGLPQARYDELVQQTVVHKVSAAVAKQIAGANPAYAEIIERSKVVTPKRQTVSVKPS